MPHPKAALIERAQAEGRGKPKFDTVRTGPEHEPVFTASVSVGGDVLGEGRGGTKREAERRAAEAALVTLDRPPARSRKGGGGREAAPADRRRKAAAAPEGPPTAAPADEASAGGPTAATPVAAAVDAPFEGPWPLFEGVLAAAIEAASRRVDDRLRGADAREAIQAFALDLYKGVLEDLGEVVDEELPEGGDELAPS